MPLSNKTIIVIDDSSAILNFLRISLESLGVNFHGSMTASGGLAQCETRKPDLIILDLGLPDKEGFDILPRLHALNKESMVPVIVLTVRNSQEDRERAVALGASMYMTKPFEMSRLLDIICEVIGTKRPLELPISGTLSDDCYPYGSAAKH